jgi:hypothetical protein
MAWTTAQDVLNSWIGEDAPTDSAKVTTWIGKAERLIRREVPDVQARIDAEAPDTELLETARDVVAAAVTRVFRNPEGRRSTSVGTGPFSESVTFGGDQPGGLYLTDEELSSLRGFQAGQRAFSIDLMPSTSPFSPYYVAPS